jgi:VWFA-related protein
VRKLLAILLTQCLLAPSSVLAQQPAVPVPPLRDHQDAEKEPYRIRTFTKLVQMPVVVTDRKGNHVRGLTKDDFLIVEEGKQRTIAAFEEVSSGSMSLQVAKRSGPVSTTEFTNASSGPTQRPIIILAMSFTYSPLGDQVQIRRQVAQYLRERVAAGTLVALVAFTRRGLVNVHELTDDPRVLVAALERVKGGTGVRRSAMNDAADAALQKSVMVGVADPTAERIAQEQSTMEALISGRDPYFSDLQQNLIEDNTLSGLRSLARAYAGVPGRKSLFWLGSGFPSYMSSINAQSTDDYTGEYLRTFEALNDANIAVYPVDTRGLEGYEPRWTNVPNTINTALLLARNPGNVTRGPRPDPGIVTAGRSAFEDEMTRVSTPTVIDNAKQAAELTGGRAFYRTNDFVGAMRKAEQDSAEYYMLGYYLRGDEDAKPGRRIVSVKVKRPGLQVRSRTRLFVAARSPEDDIGMAVRSPLQYTMLPLTVRMDASKRAAGEWTRFDLALSGQDIDLEQPEGRLDLDVMVLSRDEHGSRVDLLSKKLDGKILQQDEFRRKPFVFSAPIKLADGPGSVRFVVRDRVSGKIGSVIVDVPERGK